MIKVIVLLSEGSMSLPPRHIRRYPASSSGSSSTAGPGSLDEGEEEDVFLKYNQSYQQDTSTAADCTPISIVYCM